MLAAIKAQNVQFAAGSLGSDPAPAGQGFTATVSAEGRFTTPEQFGNIILRANSDGTTVQARGTWRASRSARRTTASTPQYNGKPTGAFGVQLLPGANALDVANAVRAKMDELAKSFPAGRDLVRAVRQHDVRDDLDQGSGRDADRRDRAGVPA